MTNIPALFAMLFALAGGASRAAEIGVTPVAIQLAGAASRSTLSLVNRGDQAVTMQAEAVTWQRDPAGSDLSTDDLVINPLIFTIAPGQSQIVRIGLRTPPDPAQERTYRVVVRELPTAPAPDTDGATRVRILRARRVPVYVAPLAPVRKEDWSVRSDAAGRLTAQVRNAGNVHYRIGLVNLREGDLREGAPIASASAGALLFPGEEQRFALAPAAPAAASSPASSSTLSALPSAVPAAPAVSAAPAAPATPARVGGHSGGGGSGNGDGKSSRPMTLEVFTDRGVQYLAVALVRD
jgi:fimbrial chaperone protein